jgi:hypothetical protein
VGIEKRTLVKRPKPLKRVCGEDVAIIDKRDPIQLGIEDVFAVEPSEEISVWIEDRCHRV